MSEKRTLLERARQIGLEVDGRWSVDTLAEKVEEAIVNQEDVTNEKVRKSADTWVYAIRDCFLGTKKMPAGSVFKAPKELHANWKANGASRLAEEDEIAKVG